MRLRVGRIIRGYRVTRLWGGWKVEKVDEIESDGRSCGEQYMECRKKGISILQLCICIQSRLNTS